MDIVYVDIGIVVIFFFCYRKNLVENSFVNFIVDVVWV